MLWGHCLRHHWLVCSKTKYAWHAGCVIFLPCVLYFCLMYRVTEGKSTKGFYWFTRLRRSFRLGFKKNLFLSENKVILSLNFLILQHAICRHCVLSTEKACNRFGTVWLKTFKVRLKKTYSPRFVCINLLTKRNGICIS